MLIDVKGQLEYLNIWNLIPLSFIPLPSMYGLPEEKEANWILNDIQNKIYHYNFFSNVIYLSMSYSNCNDSIRLEKQY